MGSLYIFDQIHDLWIFSPIPLVAFSFYWWFPFTVQLFIIIFFYFIILYCFCHTSTCIHHGCTHVPNPEPPSHHPPHNHPSGSSQCISPKHPVSCIEPGLEIHFLYDIILVSMPFSQIIPPFPSPTESKRLFYTSVSLLLSRIQGYHYHLSKFRIYVLVYCIGVFFFFFWLTSLCIIGSSFIHLIRTDSNVFFLMAE